MSLFYFIWYSYILLWSVKVNFQRFLSLHFPPTFRILQLSKIANVIVYEWHMLNTQKSWSAAVPVPVPIVLLKVTGAPNPCLHCWAWTMPKRHQPLQHLWVHLSPWQFDVSCLAWNFALRSRSTVPSPSTDSSPSPSKVFHAYFGAYSTPCKWLLFRSRSCRANCCQLPFVDEDRHPAGRMCQAFHATPTAPYQRKLKCN